MPDFISATHGSELFTTDPEFWKTVHITGDGWDEYQQQLRAKGKQEWRSKVVVKDVTFHTLAVTTDTPVQVRSDLQINLCWSLCLAIDQPVS